MINILNFGRIWKKLNLEALILVSYAPGASKYNPIERCWGYLNDCIVGSHVPDSVEIETSKGSVVRKIDSCHGVYNNQIYQKSVQKMTN